MKQQKGKLRIGDHWNAITIIALSQENPLKAVAEFVENSIDAGARNVVITRGREEGRSYLKVADDGKGILQDADGIPNFKHVATHICDSIKRHLKSEGARGIQGEFGIGLLSFWTVGEEIVLTSPDIDGKAYQMRMKRGDPTYTVSPTRRLFPAEGTELLVQPLLPGLRQLSGEKLQWYLASELRDRIRQSNVRIKIVDRTARKECLVEPREFTGRLLQHLPVPTTPYGEVYVELYLSGPEPGRKVGLYRSGTRVLEELTRLETFQDLPWTSDYLEGILDAPFLTLTPGSRTGIVQDETFAAFCQAMRPLEEELQRRIAEQQRAEQERASRQILRTVQNAFREALLALPPEEYDWFEIRSGRKGPGGERPGAGLPVADASREASGTGDKGENSQKRFFEYSGPLFSVRIAPASSVLPVGGKRSLRAVPRDRRGRLVEEGIRFQWEIIEGEGRLENASGEIVTFIAPPEPGLTRIRVTAAQQEVSCQGEALCTVADSLDEKAKTATSQNQGLPGYTFERSPGQLWRSRYDADRNLIVINNGHRDFVFASRSRAVKLRYIARLFAKEMVYRNFPGLPADQLLERLIELSLYIEEHLR